MASDLEKEGKETCFGKSFSKRQAMICLTNICTAPWRSIVEAQIALNETSPARSSLSEQNKRISLNERLISAFDIHLLGSPGRNKLKSSELLRLQSNVWEVWFINYVYTRKIKNFSISIRKTENTREENYTFGFRCASECGIKRGTKLKIRKADQKGKQMKKCY